LLLGLRLSELDRLGAAVPNLAQQGNERWDGRRLGGFVCNQSLQRVFSWGGNSQITAVFLILKVTNFWSVPKISILQYPKSTM
jgi:hypothetical protein